MPADPEPVELEDVYEDFNDYEAESEEVPRPANSPLNFHDRGFVDWGVLDDMGCAYDF